MLLFVKSITCIFLQIVEKTLTIKIYIDNNKEYYKLFESKKLEIEGQIGSKLEWRNLEDNKIKYNYEKCGI